MNSLQIIKKKNIFEISDKEKNVRILTKNYRFGKNIIFEKDIKICKSDNSPLENLIIGDNIFIGKNSTFLLPSLSILDYTKINNNFYAHGTNKLAIGYNCWIGSSVILDTLGGLVIKDNVGIGSQTQIYTHAKFGDTLYGCRINSFTSVLIEDDVWVAPGSIISSASMKKRSMLLAGSVLTKTTEENHIYAGITARDVTEKTGELFDTRLDYSNIRNRLNQYLEEFYTSNSVYKNLDLIKIELQMPNNLDGKYSYFIVNERKYIKRGSDVEIAFMKFLLPDKAKFIPY